MTKLRTGDVFTIKPLEWESLRTFGGSVGEAASVLGGILQYRVSHRHYSHRGDVYSDWKASLIGSHGVVDGFQRTVESPEEGKALAEAHWQEYIKQGLEEA